MTSPTPCWLYVLRHGEDGRDLHKVGVASDVAARVANLQIGNPLRIEVVAAFEFPDRRHAMSTESALHAMLADDRVAGEWFEAPASYILRSLALVAFDTPDEAFIPQPAGVA